MSRNRQGNDFSHFRRPGCDRMSRRTPPPRKRSAGKATPWLGRRPPRRCFPRKRLPRASKSACPAERRAPAPAPRSPAPPGSNPAGTNRCLAGACEERPAGGRSWPRRSKPRPPAAPRAPPRRRRRASPRTCRSPRRRRPSHAPWPIIRPPWWSGPPAPGRAPSLRRSASASAGGSTRWSGIPSRGGSRRAEWRRGSRRSSARSSGGWWATRCASAGRSRRTPSSR